MHRRRRKKQPVECFIQSFEARQLLSGVSAEIVDGVLIVRGSTAKDAFAVREAGTLMIVQCAGGNQTFNKSEISNVLIEAGAGNDVFTYDADLPATLLGGDGNDRITGGVGNDFIDAGPGIDKVRAGGGNDTITGGTGFDKLSGGGGEDVFYTLGEDADTPETTQDEVRGGSGRDLIHVQTSGGGVVWAGNGKDTIFGGAGNDTLRGQFGNDRIEAGDGDDFIEGNSGDDDLRGEAGNDTLRGHDGNDLLIGATGDDSLSGGGDNDALDGGDDADILIGGSGRDLLVGGDGEDTLTGSGDDDILVGDEQVGFQNRARNILREWGSANTYTQRRHNVIDGSGTGNRLNNSSFIEISSDGEQDLLSGTTATDLFFADTGIDLVNDNVDGESIEQQGACALNAQEQGIASLMESHPSQGRATTTCHLTLAQVARAKALDMGTRDYSGHTDPDGNGPNKLLREAGYVLPSFYGTDAADNNVESVAAGYATFEEAFAAWMGSPGHQQHLLGLNGFYANQIEYGVGYAFVPGSTFGHYWVFLSAYRE